MMQRLTWGQRLGSRITLHVLLAVLVCAALGSSSLAAPNVPAHLRLSSWPPSRANGLKVVGAFVSLGYWDLSRAEQCFDELASLGVNLVIDYQLTPPEDDSWIPAFEAYLDAAASSGIGVAFPLYPLLCGMSPEEPGKCMATAEITVSQLKKYPQITAWYVHDEVLPHLSGVDGTENYCISLEQMKQLYRNIRRLDLSRPQINVWCSLPPHDRFTALYKDTATLHGVQAWMNDEQGYERAMQSMVRETCDWVMVDCYPVGAKWREGAEGTPQDEVAKLVGRAAKLKRRDQPLLFVFQSFSWSQYADKQVENAPFPTLSEMNSMLYAAWEAGARGAIAYSWFDLARQDLPGASVPGREACLLDLRRVLTSISQPDWPECTMPAD